MTRDKAIDIIRRELIGKALANPEVMEAYVKLIPELDDSWNENVRKQLVETIKTAMTEGGVQVTKERGERYLKFLENMKRMELSENEVPLLESIIKDIRKGIEGVHSQGYADRGGVQGSGEDCRGECCQVCAVHSLQDP